MTIIVDVEYLQPVYEISYNTVQVDIELNKGRLVQNYCGSTYFSEDYVLTYIEY